MRASMVRAKRARLIGYVERSRLQYLRCHHPTDWGWRQLRPVLSWRDRIHTFITGALVAIWLGLVIAVWLHAL